MIIKIVFWPTELYVSVFAGSSSQSQLRTQYGEFAVKSHVLTVHTLSLCVQKCVLTSQRSLPCVWLGLGKNSVQLNFWILAEWGGVGSSNPCCHCVAQSFAATLCDWPCAGMCDIVWLNSGFLCFSMDEIWVSCFWSCLLFWLWTRWVCAC